MQWPGSSCTVSDGKCCVPKDGGYPAEDFLVESFQPFDVSINKPLVSCRNSEPFDIDKVAIGSFILVCISVLLSSIVPCMHTQAQSHVP